MKILIAEDDLTSRSILVALLNRWGYEPIAVDNGDSAWELLQQPQAPMLALLDWTMPGLNGIDVCRRVRECNSENPPYLIILTARGETSSIVKGLDAGANDYMTKPYNKDELLARLRTGQRMIKLQTELVAAKQALGYEAIHDSLTGALNRRGVLSRLEAELVRARRNKTTLSIGLCDIDHFKEINDRYGHQTGDTVLQAVVTTIKKELREYDLLGRLGGEEFLIVAPDSSTAYVEKIYERLREKVEALRFPTLTGDTLITVSIGVIKTYGSTNADSLLAEADAAMYRAKKLGRNRVVAIFAPEEQG